MPDERDAIEVEFIGELPKSDHVWGMQHVTDKDGEFILLTNPDHAPRVVRNGMVEILHP